MQQQDEAIDTTFLSRSEVDLEFKQSGERIYVRKGEKYNIPESYTLHKVNDQPLHGSGLNNVQDIQSHLLDCPASYPLKLQFVKNVNEAMYKRHQHLKLPVPVDFFGSFPELTSDEQDEYIQLANSWVEGLLGAASSSEGFNFVCKKDGVDIYQGKVPGSKIHLIRGQSKIKATKEEMKAMMISPTTASFRRLFHMIDGHFADGVMLHQFPKDYKHPNLPFYAIKWGIFAAPGPVSSRDVCWLEYGDIANDEHGNEFGFGVASSIVRPECPELCHLRLIRAEMISSGYVFKKSSEDPEYLDVTYVVQADPKGWLPLWAINMFAWQQGLNLARIRDSCEGIAKAKTVMDGYHREQAPVQGVLISAGHSHDIPITVENDSSILSFGFCSEHRDIGFQVQGLHEAEEWSRKQRYECHVKPVYGKVTVKKGRYTLHLDNTYSWLRAKHIYYWFHVQ